MKAPVWVVKMWSGGSVAVDMYWTGKGWAHEQCYAWRFRSRSWAQRLARHLDARVVRLVPRKRGGR